MHAYVSGSVLEKELANVLKKWANDQIAMCFLKWMQAVMAVEPKWARGVKSWYTQEKSPEFFTFFYNARYYYLRLWCQRYVHFTSRNDGSTVLYLGWWSEFIRGQGYILHVNIVPA